MLFSLKLLMWLFIENMEHVWSYICEIQYLYIEVRNHVSLSLTKGWMCRAGKRHWSAPPQLSWMDLQASPVAPAARTSQEWLKWRVWWRNTWLLIAKTCELITSQKLNLNLNWFQRVLFKINDFYREDEWEQDSSESGWRPHYLPPVSPYRCRRQAVLDLLFDDIWQQLVGCMKDLVQRHWECCSASRDQFYYLACIRPNIYWQMTTVMPVLGNYCTFIIDRWWKDIWEPEPCAARLSECLCTAHDAAQTWPEQGAPTHSRPAVPGQWSGQWSIWSYSRRCLKLF